IHDETQIIFGTAVDSRMGSRLSVTLISSIGSGEDVAPVAAKPRSRPKPAPAPEPEMLIEPEPEPEPAPEPEPLAPQEEPVWVESEQPVAPAEAIVEQVAFTEDLLEPEPVVPAEPVELEPVSSLEAEPEPEV